MVSFGCLKLYDVRYICNREHYTNKTQNFQFKKYAVNYFTFLCLLQLRTIQDKYQFDLITKNHFFFIFISCFRLTTILMLFLLKNAL